MSGRPLKDSFVEVSPQAFIGRPNSEGGTAVVTDEHSDGSLDVKYVLGGTEKNVARSRIISLNLFVATARQRNANDVARPSLLAPSHQPTASRFACRLATSVPNEWRVGRHLPEQEQLAQI